VRVDFYEMSGRFTDPLFVAGVLVGRAWPKSAPIAVTGTAAQLKSFDERLWSEPNDRFLPHAIDDDAAPIRLSESAPAQAAVLINLDPAGPLPSGSYERILEIVPPEESLKQQLRERWVSWKQRGAELHHHVLK
jgi:DNA polymerase-3 subunit chi